MFEGVLTRAAEGREEQEEASCELQWANSEVAKMRKGLCQRVRPRRRHRCAAREKIACRTLLCGKKCPLALGPYGRRIPLDVFVFRFFVFVFFSVSF